MNLSKYLEEQRKRGRKMDARTVKRVAQAFAPYQFQVLLVLLIILFTNGSSAFSSLLVQHLFDDGIGKRNWTALLLCIGGMIAVPVVSGIVGIWQTQLNNTVSQSVLRDLRNQLYGHLQRMSLRFFTSVKTGEIQSRLSNDINGVQGVITGTAVGLVANIAAIVSTISFMLVLSPLLTAVSLGLLPVFLVITIKVGRLRRSASKETQESLARLAAMMHETLSVSGTLLMKIFGRRAYAQQLFETENQTLTNLAIQQAMIGRWFFMLTGVFFSITFPIVYLIAGWQILSHSGPFLSIGTMVAFAGLQAKLFTPIGNLLSMQVDIQGALALFDRIFEYLDMPIEIANAPHAISLSPGRIAGQLSFRDVTFTYQRDVPEVLQDLAGKDGKNGQGKQNTTELVLVNKGRNQLEHVRELSPDPLPANGALPPPALKRISFDIQPGQLAALVGPSGAGKTTITYLVPRLYDVDSGEVLIDGHNIKDLQLASLSDAIGMVTQETYLFHASVRENLLYARLEATEEEMIAACRAAAIHERILELDDGYDTVVGERGYRLSGGEKQRIAIARVILKNPRILILDEATSALDTHSEQLIQAALEPLTRGRTTLAIAHRLSTILAADVILVVNRGEIAERGTHQELLAQDGLYAQLYREQFGAEEKEDKLAAKKRIQFDQNLQQATLQRLNEKQKEKVHKVFIKEVKRPKQRLAIDHEIGLYQEGIRKMTSDKNREIAEYLRNDQSFFALKVLKRYRNVPYNAKQLQAIQEVLKRLHQFAFKAMKILPTSDSEGPWELHPLLEHLKTAVKDLDNQMGGDGGTTDKLD